MDKLFDLTVWAIVAYSQGFDGTRGEGISRHAAR